MKFDLILDDLLSIPKALLTCLRYYLSEDGRNKLETIKSYIQESKIKRIIFVGHAYNYFASIIPLRYLNSHYFSRMEEHQGSTEITCVIHEIDEFNSYYNPLRNLEDTIFIFITSSGNSNQIREGLKKLFDANVDPQRIWGISDYEESYLGMKSHYFLPLKFGTEKIMGTKSYVNAILLFYLVCRSAMNKEAIPSKREEDIRQLIFEIKFYNQDWENHTKNLTDFLGEKLDNLFFISKGASLSSAYQASLNFKAITQTFCVALSMGAFQHGPIRIVDESFRGVLIIGDETSMKESTNLIEEITNYRGGKLILLNNSRKISSIGRSNNNIFVFEHTTENINIAPIFEIIVLQYLFLQIAKTRGLMR